MQLSISNLDVELTQLLSGTNLVARMGQMNAEVYSQRWQALVSPEPETLVYSPTKIESRTSYEDANSLELISLQPALSVRSSRTSFYSIQSRSTLVNSRPDSILLDSFEENDSLLAFCPPGQLLKSNSIKLSVEQTANEILQDTPTAILLVYKNVSTLQFWP
ncbi:hypothetical protein Ciccas_009561 [Cichlidogyrus casuarinus]|uniref:Uncharacterized protein n=1 Tax=Cichlidogyrus casuarinus TaxID=1844966 RepID=A0ABD2PWN3_9PLAT